MGNDEHSKAGGFRDDGGCGDGRDGGAERSKAGGFDGRGARGDGLLEHAMDRFGSMVLRLAVAQTGNAHDAEDVAQDVFLRLLQVGTRFEDDEHLKAWLLRVTVNRCHDLGRKRGRRPTASLDELPFEPAEAVCDRDALDAAWRAVQELPEDQRAVVHLVCVEGYGCEEAARLLGVSAGAARARLFRARRTLKTQIGGVDYA